MNWLRFVFITALLVIFVVSTIAALFGAGKVLNALFRAYVFKVEVCDYRPYPYKPTPIITEKTTPQSEEHLNIKDLPPGSYREIPQSEEPQKECKIDFNRSKEDISDGLAMFIIAAPLAFVFFRKTRKFIYEG